MTHDRRRNRSAVPADDEAASVGCAPAADVEAVDVGSAAMLTTRRGSFPVCVLVTCHIAGLVLGGICKIVKSTTARWSQK